MGAFCDYVTRVGVLPSIPYSPPKLADGVTKGRNVPVHNFRCPFLKGMVMKKSILWLKKGCTGAYIHTTLEPYANKKKHVSLTAPPLAWLIFSPHKSSVPLLSRSCLMCVSLIWRIAGGCTIACTVMIHADVMSIRCQLFQVGSQKFSAHRIVLAATIPYFQAMFTHDMVEAKQDEINMQGIDAW